MTFVMGHVFDTPECRISRFPLYILYAQYPPTSSQMVSISLMRLLDLIYLESDALKVIPWWSSDCEGGGGESCTHCGNS